MKKKRYFEITVIAILCVMCAWCFIALLINPSLEVSLEDIDVHPTKGYVAFKYTDSGAMDDRNIVVKCCDSNGNTVFTTRHSSPEGGTSTSVRFVDDFLVVFLDRYNLVRVYDFNGNLITDHDISPTYFASAEERELFEKNSEKWYEVSGINYKYETGNLWDFLLFKMYYRLVAVHENGETVVIYQA